MEQAVACFLPSVGVLWQAVIKWPLTVKKLSTELNHLCKIWLDDVMMHWVQSENMSPPTVTVRTCVHPDITCKFDQGRGKRSGKYQDSYFSEIIKLLLLLLLLCRAVILLHPPSDVPNTLTEAGLFRFRFTTIIKRVIWSYFIFIWFGGWERFISQLWRQ